MASSETYLAQQTGEWAYVIATPTQDQSHSVAKYNVFAPHLSMSGEYLNCDDIIRAVSEHNTEHVMSMFTRDSVVAKKLGHHAMSDVVIHEEYGYLIRVRFGCTLIEYVKSLR